jgi:hypothetical protein
MACAGSPWAHPMPGDHSSRAISEWHLIKLLEGLNSPWQRLSRAKTSTTFAARSVAPAETSPLFPPPQTRGPFGKAILGSDALEEGPLGVKREKLLAGRVSSVQGQGRQRETRPHQRHPTFALEQRSNAGR